MADGTVNGSGNGARSGAHALGLLAVPLNVLILRALANGPRRQGELRRETGSPAQSTLRSHLKGLEKIGVVVKRRLSAFPRSLEYELERPGEELLFVISALEHWLAAAPEDPLELGGDAAKAAIKAMAEGWSSTIIRALAARPLSLTELDSLIGTLSYPSLERRLGAMRLAGQVEAMPNGGRGTPYAVTEWLRRGVAPLAAGSRWERRNLPSETRPISRIDAEAGLLLAVPLLRTPTETSGSCRLVVELADGDGARPAAVTATVDEGRVVSCVSRPEADAGAWATGPPNAWFRAVIEANPAQLEVGGDCSLARALLEGLYVALFGAGALRGSR